MRIGIDVKTLSKRYTGIAVYVYEMIKYFNEFATTDEFYLYSHKDFELDFDLNSNFHKVIYKGITGSIGIMFQLAGLLKKDKIDIFWGTEHCLVWGKHSFKQVVTIHDLSALHNPKVSTRYNAFLQRFMAVPSCRRADRIIAISNSTAKDIIDNSGVKPEKVSVIYNGDSPYRGISKEYTTLDHSKMYDNFKISPNQYFLFVGSIEPRKNIITIVKGYNEYRDNGGSNKLVLVGGLGWRYEAILSEIKRSKYVDDIIMTGYVMTEDKEYLYRNATCLVFPSLWEGFGFPVLEAMSVGTPVITSNISSLPEVGGNAALYIDDCFNYRQLSKYMSKISEMSAVDRFDLMQKCIEQANKFSREDCAKQILKLFHSM